MSSVQTRHVPSAILSSDVKDVRVSTRGINQFAERSDEGPHKNRIVTASTGRNGRVGRRGHRLFVRHRRHTYTVPSNRVCT